MLNVFLQVLVPLYVSEVAPVHLRGGLGVFNQLAVTSGIFLGQVVEQRSRKQLETPLAQFSRRS